MVVETVPFTFPRTGRMTVTDDKSGNLAVTFAYLNGHGAMVTRSAGSQLFRLVALDAAGDLGYLPGVLGDGVRTARYLTADEVDVLLIRIAGLPGDR